MTLNLIYTAVIVFIFNIPFGYWRRSEKKFSKGWILSIHLPVPVVIGLRFLFKLGFRFITYPVLVGSFFSGQYIGSKIYSYRESNEITPLTSNLIKDLISDKKSNK